MNSISDSSTKEWEVAVRLSTLRAGQRIVFEPKWGGDGEVVTASGGANNHFGTWTLGVEELDYDLEFEGDQLVKIVAEPEEQPTTHDLPMGGCSSWREHERHLAAGDPLCENQREAPKENHATREFNMHWLNDQDLYDDVILFARHLLRQVGGKMTPQTLGRNIKDRVYAWKEGGGWGYDNPPKHVRALEYLRVPHAEVQEELVAEEVYGILGIEGYSPETGEVV